MSHRIRVMAAIMAVFYLTGFALWTARDDSGYLLTGPGPVIDITGTVSGTAATFRTDTTGQFLGTTVTAEPVSNWELWRRFRTGRMDQIVPAQSLTGTDPAIQLSAMTASHRLASAVATQILTDPATYFPAGPPFPPVVSPAMAVLSVEPNSAAAQTLTAGDLIVKVDSNPVPVDPDRFNTLFEAGRAATLSVERSGMARQVTVTPDRYGRIGVAVTVTSGPAGTDFTADTTGIGGSSAGLMLTLGFLDAGSPGDLTGGRLIAGTGTLFPDGTVGPISGVDQKVVAASNAGATIFLVPTPNRAAAASTAPPGLVLVEVSTVFDAVTWLCSTGSTDQLCAAVPGA